MEAMNVVQRVSAEEYLELDLPRGTNLIDGEIVVAEPSPLHQRTLKRVMRALDAWCDSAGGRGETFLPLDVALDADNAFAPDVLWYRAGREPADRAPRPHPIPDLAVEVRSPSTWRYDIGAKKKAYERHGLPELGLVDTAADEVLIFRRSAPAAPTFDVAEELGHGETLTSPLLPGFAPALDALFPPRSPG